MLSAGLYLIYWFYLTLTQMDSETGEEHHTVWHALSLLVPIYGLFKMHGHIKVIKGIVEGAGLVAALSPDLAVVLFMIGNALDWSSFRVDDTAALLVMGVISAALSTTLVALAQNSLNQYWEYARGTGLREARVGVGEVIFVILGILIWVGTSLPVE